MSFSYKTLNSTDLTLTSYIANKLWEVKNSTLSENGITIYIGENLPLNRNNIFDPIDDIETSNEEYRRLVFESIKHLYYENYISGSDSGEFFQSSSYFNYDQTTLTSGSMISSFKTLPTLTGSANIKIDAYDESIRYDSPYSIYDQSIFDPNRGGKVVLIAVDKEVFGSGLSPNSVFISGSGYYLRDDGEGNLYNYQNEANYARYNSAIYDKDIYLEIINNRTPQLEYVGNVFYSHGMIIITNENYLCAFGAPPSAVNDYFSYFNMDTPQIFDPLGNDISDCGSINFDSFVAHPYPGKTFPDFTYENGFLSIIPNHKSVIPANHQIGYSIENVYGLQSNTGSINIEITSKPLRITNIVSSSTCYGSTVEQPVTFSIDYGVPYYSYSLDYGETYTPVDNLFNVRVSGSIVPSDNSMIYIKDYLGEVISSSLDLWYPEIIFTPILTRVNCDSSSTGEITVTGNEGLTTSINGDTYFDIPHTFTGLSNGTYTIYAKNEYDCIRTKTATVVSAPPISLVSTLRHINCFGSSTGQISLNVINPSTNYSTVWKNSSNITVGTSNTLSNVPTGSYTVYITDNNINGCQSISATYALTGSARLIASSTASYINAESTSIIINAVGGVAPYTYYAINNSNGTVNNSSTPTVTLSSLGLNGGSFTTYVVDSLGCSSNNVLIDIFGRNYIYSGSACETV
jgi:hypothetical protein